MLLTENIRRKLIKNFKEGSLAMGGENEIDFMPVVRLVSGECSWILSELDPKTNLAFGLCDLGYPELGYVDINELVVFKDEVTGDSVSRDLDFIPDKTLNAMADEQAKTVLEKVAIYTEIMKKEPLWFLKQNE